MPAHRRHNIWVVDDSPLDAERARRALARLHDVEVLTDGSLALERLVSGPPPDVVVLDWLMPGVTGIDVCRFIRSAPHLPQVSILLLTSQQATEQIVEGLAAGANDYLAKPYADEELIARVSTLLRTKDLASRFEDAQAELAALVESSPDALLSVAPDGTVVAANPEAERVFGRRRGQLRDLQIEEVLQGFSLEDARRGLPLGDVTCRDRMYSPTVRSHGARRAMTISLRDVTERRRADAKRLDLYAIIAHDLRSPLQALLMRLEMILKGRRGPLAADLVGDLHRIDGGLRSLVTMINDFLDLARLDAGTDLKRSAIDLGDVIATSLDELKPLADATGLTLGTEPSGVALVLGDRRRLGQVFSNLIGNAIKFTPRNGRVFARVQVLDDAVEASIHDTGPGIPPEAQQTIFNRFTRVPGSEAVIGTGLGLMIVREIVEAHGGSVGVRSTPGEGSTFWVRLPRAPEPLP